MNGITRIMTGWAQGQVRHLPKVFILGGLSTFVIPRCWKFVIPRCLYSGSSGPASPGRPRVENSRGDDFRENPTPQKNPSQRHSLKALAVFLLALAITPCAAHAASKNTGTSGAQFLKIGAGPRPTAMGDAFVAVADDANTVFYNPAGLAFIHRPELTVMHTQWFEEMSYQLATFAYPTDTGALALSAITLTSGDIDQRGSDETRLGSFTAQDAAYTASYGRHIGPLTAFGVTGRFIDQRIGSASANTWAGDLGLLRKLGRCPLSLGLAARNMGGKVAFGEHGDPLPFTVDAGVGARLFRERLKMGLDVRFPRDNSVSVGVGSEINMYTATGLRLALRAGFNSARTDADAAGVAFGGGIGIGRLQMDMSYQPLGELGNTFRYGLTMRF